MNPLTEFEQKMAELAMNQAAKLHKEFDNRFDWLELKIKEQNNILAGVVVKNSMMENEIRRIKERLPKERGENVL
jgi:peptidoglycan hydrolase CwlO-like protein